MRVVIFGLGQYQYGSGSAAARYFAKQGHDVRITDIQPAQQLHQATIRLLQRRRNVQFILGKHRRSDIAWADVIIRNPGVPDNQYMQYAQTLGKPITNDVGVFLAELHGRFGDQGVQTVAVTGTRGKSTTTALIAKLLQAKYGRRVHVGGNIGHSPLFFLNQVTLGDIVVLEMSSWLLRDLHHPHFTVAVITNMLRDHMNYYPNMRLYQRDKERIFLGQTNSDYAVVDVTDTRVRRMIKHTSAKIVPFTAHRLLGMQLLGEHNRRNFGAAWEVAKIFGVPINTRQRVMRRFSGIPHRLEKIRQYRGRTFYNDTTATTPDATIAALLSFRHKIILIAGGNSKNLSLTALVKLIPQHVKTLILLPGNATSQFPAGILVRNMRQAVQLAWQHSQSGDTIVLSPGVTWLPLMNEFERGRQFGRYVAQLR
ncbi:MAG: hypothetical protein HYV33_04905 [Candidatus Kerfeldbacteria bacterium]|nr:hypothetical protein [Candidatus Kerfeldbacteria bacterium]